MGKNLLSFLDLMMGYVGAMFLLIALTSGDRGKEKIPERYAYFHFEIDFVLNQGAEKAVGEMPFSIEVERLEEPSPVVFRNGKQVRYVVHSSEKIDSDSAAGLAGAKFTLFVKRKGLQALLETCRISRVLIFGERSTEGNSLGTISGASDENLRIIEDKFDRLFDEKRVTDLPVRVRFK